MGSGVLEGTIPHLKFTVEIQSNNLTHHQTYTKKQQITYQLIKFLHDVEGLGYRKISHHLNGRGYKSVRGKIFKNGHIQSILNKGLVRKERIKNMKSHKDYGYEFSTYLTE